MSKERCKCVGSSSSIRRAVVTTIGKGDVRADVSVNTRRVIRGCIGKFGRTVKTGGVNIVIRGPSANRVVTVSNNSHCSLGGPESLSTMCARSRVGTVGSIRAIRTLGNV